MTPNFTVAYLAPAPADEHPLAQAALVQALRPVVRSLSPISTARDRGQLDRAPASTRWAGWRATQAQVEQADGARHASVARAAELMCTQLLAERIRAADELASRPRLARS